VGNAASNGTAGAITTGQSRITSQSFPRSIRVGNIVFSTDDATDPPTDPPTVPQTIGPAVPQTIGQTTDTVPQTIGQTAETVPQTIGQTIGQTTGTNQQVAETIGQENQQVTVINQPRSPQENQQVTVINQPRSPQENQQVTVIIESVQESLKPIAPVATPATPASPAATAKPPRQPSTLDAGDLQRRGKNSSLDNPGSVADQILTLDRTITSKLPRNLVPPSPASEQGATVNPTSIGTNFSSSRRAADSLQRPLSQQSSSFPHRPKAPQGNHQCRKTRYYDDLSSGRAATI
jgi:hypothetical protein